MKKRKADIFFNPIDGSAPLSIYWYDGPKGDAVEAINQKGVGFFGPSGELLGVIFDDVSEKNDQQILHFSQASVEIQVENGVLKTLEVKVGTKKKRSA